MTLRREKALVALGMLGFLGGGFFLTAAWNATRLLETRPWFALPLDTHLPLVPAFVFVYLSWYPATTVVLWGDREAFRRAYLAYAVAFLLCLVGYIAWPATITRPIVHADDGPAHAALAVLYAIDPPTNLFPSFHAAIAMILLQLGWATRLRVVAAAWFVGLCAACVLVRQHFLLDVGAGVVVGGVAIACADRLPATNHRRWRASLHAILPERSRVWPT